VFDVAQGWEPLCRFLGVTVPDVPFPRVNTREEHQRLQAMARGGGAPTLEEVRRILQERNRRDA
jgi:hypothetical protein